MVPLFPYQREGIRRRRKAQVETGPPDRTDRNHPPAANCAEATCCMNT
jgi:hypothetical protein